MQYRLAKLYRMWRQRTRDRRMAAQFSDRELWDVGLTRGDIHREFARPLWQAIEAHDSVGSQPIGATRCSQPMRAAATAAR